MDGIDGSNPSYLAVYALYTCLVPALSLIVPDSRLKGVLSLTCFPHIHFKPPSSGCVLVAEVTWQGMPSAYTKLARYILSVTSGSEIQETPFTAISQLFSNTASFVNSP